jgi:ribonuclease P protein component
VIGRLKRRAEFLHVAAARKKWAAPGLILQVCPSQNPPNFDTAETPVPAALRVGFTASKKVGNAVQRNRARRRLKAVVGEVLPRHGVPGYDLVLIARPATIDRPYRDLIIDFTAALKRMRVYAEAECA